MGAASTILERLSVAQRLAELRLTANHKGCTEGLVAAAQVQRIGQAGQRMRLMVLKVLCESGLGTRQSSLASSGKRNQTIAFGRGRTGQGRGLLDYHVRIGAGESEGRDRRAPWRSVAPWPGLRLACKRERRTVELQ